MFSIHSAGGGVDLEPKGLEDLGFVEAASISSEHPGRKPPINPAVFLDPPVIGDWPLRRAWRP
jgi:hypothetical protein